MSLLVGTVIDPREGWKQGIVLVFVVTLANYSRSAARPAMRHVIFQPYSSISRLLINLTFFHFHQLILLHEHHVLSLLQLI